MQEKQDRIEIDLKELFWVLIQGLKWIFLAMLAGGIAAFAITYFLVPPQYSSSVSLYVNNTGETEKTANAAMNINDINASQKLVNTYIVILQDDGVMEQLAQRLMNEYEEDSLEKVISLKPNSLRSVITLSAVNNTEVLRIEAKTSHAELSARICSIMTDLAPEILQRVVKAGSVEVIGGAKPAEKATSPSFPLNVAIGVAAGLMLAVGILLARHMLDNTVKTEEDLLARFDVPVLGEIPDFQTARKDGYKEYGYN